MTPYTAPLYNGMNTVYMMSDIDPEAVNHLVLHKQHLTNNAGNDNIVRIVDDIGGLHATGTKEPYLALFARTGNFIKEQLDNELYVKRSLGKIRCMRGTLYILTKEMIPVAYSATRTMVEKLSRQYAEYRGVSPEQYSTIAQSIIDIVTGRELSTAELKRELALKLNLSAILNLMCDQGLLVRIQSGNSWKAKNYTYALFHEYFSDIDLTELNETESTTSLILKYLGSFGPATESDIAWWTGLTKTKVKESLDRIRGQIQQLNISNLAGDFIVLNPDMDLITNRAPAGKTTVNLLPTLDPYIMGYKQRDRYLDQENYDNVFDRSGNATSTILLNGRIIGVWDFSEAPVPRLELFLFNEVKDEILQEIYSRAQKTGQFIAGEAVTIERRSSMVPLRQRTAGAFMSPLKD